MTFQAVGKMGGLGLNHRWDFLGGRAKQCMGMAWYFNTILIAYFTNYFLFHSNESLKFKPNAS